MAIPKWKARLQNPLELRAMGYWPKDDDGQMQLYITYKDRVVKRDFPDKEWKLVENGPAVMSLMLMDDAHKSFFDPKPITRFADCQKLKKLLGIIDEGRRKKHGQKNRQRPDIYT